MAWCVHCQGSGVEMWDAELGWRPASRTGRFWHIRRPCRTCGGHAVVQADEGHRAQPVANDFAQAAAA